MGRAFLGCALGVIGMALAAPSAAEQLVVNNRTRTYVVERPAAKGPQPTIIVLQGTDGTGAPIIQFAKLSTLAPKQGFVAVFPDGPRPHWNFFPPGGEPEFYVKAGAAAGGVPDDGAFLKGLVANLVQRGIADPQRVYLAGESSGSAMALRMFCTNADLFAGVALLGPGMPERLGMDCHPSRPLPVLLIKGTKDEVYPYSGGLMEPDETFLVWSNDRLVNFLQQVNSHPGAPRNSFLPLKVPNTVAIDRWESCSGTLLTVYRVIDGAHAAPSDLNAGQVVLNFFASPMRSNSCVAALPGSGANPGQLANAGAGANGNANAPGPSTDPSSQSAPAGAGTSANGTPNTATADPGAAGSTPSTATGQTASDPNASGGMTSPAGPGDTGSPGSPANSVGNPGTNTAGLGPPSDGNPANPTGALGPPPDGSNPGTNTAGLGPPPNNNPGNPTGALGPPPDPPMNNPPAPGDTTTALLPPGGYSPPIYIPIPGAPPNICNPKPASAPGNVCHPTPKPGNVCNPRPPNVCNRPPSTAVSTPPNPCNKPATPLILRPNPAQTAAIPPPQNTGMIRLRPATPIVPASVTPVGPANPCVPKKAVTTADPSAKKKKQAEKKHPPAVDNSAADAIAAAATAAAIIGIVGGMRHRGGGGGGYRGNPCHH
jgi:polyhydroxybutyrate depolymerase